ncbi:hypothetical protein MDAP_002274 [Mitosporidium daphniae]
MHRPSFGSSSRFRPFTAKDWVRRYVCSTKKHSISKLPFRYIDPSCSLSQSAIEVLSSPSLSKNSVILSGMGHMFFLKSSSHFRILLSTDLSTCRQPV